VNGKVTRSMRDTAPATPASARTDGFGRQRLARSNSLMGGGVALHSRFRPACDEVVGPGSYAVERARPSSLPAPVAVSMATSLRPRLSRQGSVEIIKPGPGDYLEGDADADADADVDAVGGGGGGGFGGGGGATPFSKATRQQRMRTYAGPHVPREVPDKQAVPGPGQYDQVGAGVLDGAAVRTHTPLQLTGRKQRALSSVPNSPAFAFTTAFRAVSSADPSVS